MGGKKCYYQVAGKRDGFSSCEPSCNTASAIVDDVFGSLFSEDTAPLTIYHTIDDIKELALKV